jgi:CRP/FNR family transcriptional regulator, cyclic AMP receptor protein
MAEPKSDRDPAGHRLAEPLGEHVQPGDQSSRHVEPREVGCQTSCALGSTGQQRRLLPRQGLAQAPGPDRAGGRLRDRRTASVGAAERASRPAHAVAERATRLADAVAGPEHVEHEPSSVVAEHLDHESSSRHDPHRRAWLPLLHDGSPRTHHELDDERLRTARQEFRHRPDSFRGEKSTCGGAAPYPEPPTSRGLATDAPNPRDRIVLPRARTDDPPGTCARKEDLVAKPKQKLEPVLAAVPLFEGLSKRHLKKVAEIAEMANFMQGASIVKEGAPGDSFYVALVGEAKVTVKGRTVHRILPGDHFGEISLLDGGERTATVRAETPMTLLMIQRKNFLKELERDPDVAVSLLESLARMIRRVDHSLAR